MELLLRDVLRWAEDIFGERDTSWNLIEQPVFGCRNPNIFFPGPTSLRLVMIRLSPEACDKWTFALFQIAHEVIHLLNPIKGAANYLEEGVACAFAAYVQRECGITGYAYVNDNLPAYTYARSLVRKLPNGAIEAAKSIRREMPGTGFSAVSVADLMRLFPDLDIKHASILTSTFERDRTDFR